MKNKYLGLGAVALLILICILFRHWLARQLHGIGDIFEALSYLAICLAVLVGIIYLTFIPYFIAKGRKTKNQGLIFTLTLVSCVFCWFPFLSIPLWIGMLIMACTGKDGAQIEKERILMDRQLAAVSRPTPPHLDMEEEIRRLARLKADGLLTETEFQEKKRSVLGI